MAQFDSGVSWYNIGTARVKVAFPEGQIRCQYCRFIRNERELKRNVCQLTDEYILDPFSFDRGHECPITFENTEF